jgi:rubrerythrin
MAISKQADDLLKGFAELLVQKQEKTEAEEESEEWAELYAGLEKISEQQERHGRQIDHFANRFDLYIQAMNRFNRQIEGLLDPPRAVCDDCKVWVDLSHRDHGPGYIQDLGWSIEGKKLYCPICTRKRNGL